MLDKNSRTKAKGDFAEIAVALDLIGQGYRIAFPYGEDWDFDLIVRREEQLERVQVKYTESNGEVIRVECRSHSLTNGKVKKTKRYTAAMIDWLAVYDRTSDRCYYVPAWMLAEGRATLWLRLTPPKNGQRARIRFAERYLSLEGEPDPALLEVEPAGLEPAPSCLQSRRSSN
jgi:PD-(D/E)XK endonuclease